MKVKILCLVFVLILLVGSVYAFSEDNVINNLVNSLGLNKPFLKDKGKTIIKENTWELITARAVTGEKGACGALNGICVSGECPDGYWLDPSLGDSCSENQQCCTVNVIYEDSLQSVGRVYVYGGISLVARIDPE